MAVDYLERIGAGFHHDVWLVRVDGELAQAQVFDGSDPDWERQVADATRPWVGFSHPHVLPVHAVEHTDHRLVIVHGDERSPSLFKTARRIEDTQERTVWACDAIASIAEAIATMAWRQPGFVHERATSEQIVVERDGHARLRSPVAFVAWGEGRNFTGRGNQMAQTVRFIAPEQVRGARSTPASDVHSLANTLFAALTGRGAYDHDSELDTLMAIERGVIVQPMPEAPAPLVALLQRSLARAPEERPRDPATFAAELRRVMPEAPTALLCAKVAMLRPEPSRPAPHESELIVGQRCPKKWDDLAPTASDGVRHCGQCNHDVVQVRSLRALVPLLGQRCISYKPPDGN